MKFMGQVLKQLRRSHPLKHAINSFCYGLSMKGAPEMQTVDLQLVAPF